MAKQSYTKAIRSKSTGMYPTANLPAHRLNAVHEVQRERSFGQPGFQRSEWWKDEQAELQMRAGWNKRNQKCPECFVLMPCTGECYNCSNE